MAAEILFTVDVNGEQAAVVEAIASVEGIKAWWTDACGATARSGARWSPHSRWRRCRSGCESTR